MSQTFESILSGTSPASASTVVGTDVAGGLAGAETLTITATLRGATGGVLDIYLQTSFDDGATWVDFAHFAQLTAALAVSTKVWHLHRSTVVSTATAIGGGTTPLLAVNTVLGGTWGPRMRILYVAGASTSAGAAQSISLRTWRP